MTPERFAHAELPGGITVVTEEMPGIRSAAVGVWVRFGSAHERLEEMGVAHLLEHMVFKGTERRSAREIALVLERLGGWLDAGTTAEHTNYSAHVLDESLGVALDVLADLTLRPRLRAKDLELERKVVLEEISMIEDSPAELAMQLHAEALWGDHPYGHNILGTRETVAALDTEALRRAHARAYRRPNLVVAAAGHIRHAEVVERVEALWSGAPAGGEPLAPPAEPAAPRPRTEHVVRPAAQTQLVFGTRTFGRSDPRRYALKLLTSAFGAGMSSRLFQRVREERGLAYDVGSFQDYHARAGVAGVYVATRHEQAEAAEAVIREELARLARDGLTAEEFADSKSQAKGELVLVLESSTARMGRLAGFALYGEPFLTVEELIARFDAVTREEVAAVAADCFDPERQVVLRLGPET